MRCGSGERSRREEFDEQTKLAGMLAKYLDPANTFWTSLENKPISQLSGIFRKRRGVRSGLPDVLIIFQQEPGKVFVLFVELKSRRGVASKAQKKVRAELVLAGAEWWMARSARAAMMTLHRSGVVFRRQGSCHRSSLGRGRSPTRIRACRERQRWRPSGAQAMAVAAEGRVDDRSAG
jgi:VRR-NUC domain